MPTEDIQLNTRVFQWPKDMASVFELAKTRTGHRRDQVEEDLRSVLTFHALFDRRRMIYVCKSFCLFNVQGPR